MHRYLRVRVVQVEQRHPGQFAINVVGRMPDRVIGVQGVVFGVGVKVTGFGDVLGWVAEIGIGGEREPRAPVLFEVI